MTHTETGCNGLIVFTDLDGTLLDHETYDWSPARPALDALRGSGYCLVLASSKTAAEIAPLRAELGFAHCPAIVENGAGLLQPGDADDGFDAADHRRILQALATLPGALRQHFAGFSDWSAEEIARRTGLAPHAARNAAKRQYSEPGTWSGSADDFTRFTRALQSTGIVAQKGGRFVTLSFGATKAERMVEIVTRMRKSEPNLLAVALGDAPNDIAMLEQADMGFIIRNDSHQGIPPLKEEKSGRVARSTGIGPAGWNECVLSVVAELDRYKQDHDG